MTQPTQPTEPTEPTDQHDEPLPPDPAAYDDPRAELARRRGLAAPYIAGGRDPDPADGLREERVYGRLLLIMVIAILGITLILTIAAIALGAFGYSGR
ncbi:MAG TPA: hypothetical protein VFI28_11630 [Candidatus Limnocylindrales bacterium]|nr:hypothetical protein [Candidatus Limnocylindrales bacterium]